MRVLTRLAILVLCTSLTAPAYAVNAQRDNGSAGGKRGAEASSKDRTIMRATKEKKNKAAPETVEVVEPVETPTVTTAEPAPTVIDLGVESDGGVTSSTTATGVPSVTIDVIRADGTVESWTEY
jgi:hypothetical protein